MEPLDAGADADRYRRWPTAQNSDEIHTAGEVDRGLVRVKPSTLVTLRSLARLAVVEVTKVRAITDAVPRTRHGGGADVHVRGEVRHQPRRREEANSEIALQSERPRIPPNRPRIPRNRRERAPHALSARVRHQTLNLRRGGELRMGCGRGKRREKQAPETHSHSEFGRGYMTGCGSKRCAATTSNSDLGAAKHRDLLAAMERTDRPGPRPA